MRAQLCFILIGVATLGPVSRAARLAEPRPAVLGPLERQPIRSPDGTWILEVVGTKTDPWLAVRPTGPESPTRLIPIPGSCDVLWRRDSSAFAVTDFRFANHDLIYAGHKSGDSFRLVPLSPKLEAALRASLRGRYDVDKIYAKALRWLPGNALLVGLDVVIFKHVRPLPDWQPAMELYRGYVMDAIDGRVLQVLTREAVASVYHIDLEHTEW